MISNISKSVNQSTRLWVGFREVLDEMRQVVLQYHASYPGLYLPTHEHPFITSDNWRSVWYYNLDQKQLQPIPYEPIFFQNPEDLETFKRMAAAGLYDETGKVIIDAAMVQQLTLYQQKNSLELWFLRELMDAEITTWVCWSKARFGFENMVEKFQREFPQLEYVQTSRNFVGAMYGCMSAILKEVEIFVREKPWEMYAMNQVTTFAYEIVRTGDYRIFRWEQLEGNQHD